MFPVFKWLLFRSPMYCITLAYFTLGPFNNTSHVLVLQHLFIFQISQPPVTGEDLFAKKNSEIQEKIERLKREKEEEAKRKEKERQSARAAKDEKISILARLKAAVESTRHPATGNTSQAATGSPSKAATGNTYLVSPLNAKKAQQEVDVVIEQEVDEDVWMEEICSICESDKHIFKQCPLYYCHDCGERGHMVSIFQF